MRVIIVFGSILILFQYCSNKTKNTIGQNIDLAITDVNIIDVLNHKIQSDKTILIDADTIVAVLDTDSKQAYSSQTTIVDGSRKYVMNGFWNMHTHICWKPDLNTQLFPVLLSYGITGVRDMGGDLNILNKFKSQLVKNPDSGPILYGSGPILDGEYPIHPDFSVALTKVNIKELLDSLQRNKVDFLKVYSLLPKELVAQISVFSRKNNIPFAGHVSEFIIPLEAAELGQKSFEHLNRIEDLRFDTTALNKFTEAAISNGSSLCPTLIIYQKIIALAEGKDLYHPLYEKLDESLLPEWEDALRRKGGIGESDEELHQYKTRFEALLKLVKKLHEKGLSMFVGSDYAGMPYVYPGLGFHEEMALLSKAGIDNYEILKMASYNPTIYFGISTTHGTVEKGKVADLVIFNDNPIENIQNTLKIFQVIKSGTLIMKANNKDH